MEPPYKLYHELKQKPLLATKPTTIPSAVSLASRTNKTKSKNMTYNISTNEKDRNENKHIKQQYHVNKIGRSRQKSKQKSREKEKQISYKNTTFNEVVDKFKKLFDEKIKLVKDQTTPITERVDHLGKCKKNLSSNQYNSGKKVKKTTSTAVLGYKRCYNKQGFSQLLNNIEEKLNLPHKRLERISNNEREKEKYLMSVDGIGNSITLPVQYNKKDRKYNTIEHNNPKQKSKQKNRKSKSKQVSKKYNNATFSAAKNTDRQRMERSSCKNKQKYIYQEKEKGNSTIRYNSGNLASREKYKNRLKTFEDQVADSQGIKLPRKQLKNKKQPGNKKGKLNPGKKKNKKQKQTKEPLVKRFEVYSTHGKNEDKSKPHSSKSPFTSRPLQIQTEAHVEVVHKPQRRKVIGFMSNNHKDRVYEDEQLQISRHAKNYVVSSSSDIADESEQEQEQSSFEHCIQKSQAEEEQRHSEEVENMLGSVIMYNVGNEGDLQFLTQRHEKGKALIDKQYIQDNNQKNDKYSDGEMESQTQTQKYPLLYEQIIEKYLRGFLEELTYIEQKSLIRQFHGSQHLQSNKNENKITIKQFISQPIQKTRPKLNTIRNQVQSSPSSSQQSLTEKKVMNIEETIEEQRQKWLNLKSNLEEMRRKGNFDELDKIIREAQSNHIALKSMGIRQKSHFETQPTKIFNHNKAIKAQKQFQEPNIATNRSIYTEKVQQSHPFAYAPTMTNNDPNSNQNQYSTSYSEEVTIKLPNPKTNIINNNNHINININISDTEIKIESPNKNINYTTKPKVVKREDKNELEEDFKRDINKIVNKAGKKNIDEPEKIKQNENIKIKEERKYEPILASQIGKQCKQNKEDKVREISQNQLEFYRQSSSISESQLELQLLVNQFSSKKEYPKLDQPAPKQQSKDQRLSNNYIFNKPQQNAQSPFNVGLPKTNKTKLSYDEAPLQIKKILKKSHPQEIIKQTQTKSRQNSERMLKEALELGQFISHKTIQKSSNKDREQKQTNLLHSSVNKKEKIIEELRSPNNKRNLFEYFNKLHNNNIHLQSHTHSYTHSDTHSNNGRNKNNEMESSIEEQHNSSCAKSKNRIKISLFKGSETRRERRIYKSEGQLLIQQQKQGEKQQQIAKKQNRKGNNFIVFKQKNNKSSKQLETLKQTKDSKISSDYKDKNEIVNSNNNPIIWTNVENDVESQTLPTKSQLLNDSNQIKKEKQKDQRNEVIEQKMEFKIYVNSQQDKVIEANNNESNNQHSAHKNVYKKLFPWLNDNQQSRLPTPLIISKTPYTQESQFEPFTESFYPPPQPSPVNRELLHASHQHSQNTSSADNRSNKFVINKPKYSLPTLNQCSDCIIDQFLIDEFVNDMIDEINENENEFGEIRYDINKMGKLLLEFFNINNIEITGGIHGRNYRHQEQEQQEENDKNGSPFYRIQRYRDTQQVDQVQQNIPIIIQKPTSNNIIALNQSNRQNNIKSPNTNLRVSQYAQEFQIFFQEHSQQGENKQEGENDQYYVKSDLHYMVNMANGLLEYIHMNEKKYKDFMMRLRKPLGIDTVQFLKAMRQTYQDEDQNEEGDEGEPECQLDIEGLDLIIIPLEIFAEFELQVAESTSSTNQQIFNQAVYDTLNSILDELRPYGIKGMPPMNFIHNCKTLDENNRQVLDYSRQLPDARLNKIPRFQDITKYIESKLTEICKVKLGSMSYDIDSDRLQAYSLTKTLEEYANELEGQFKIFDDSDFFIKHCIMFNIEEFIMVEEVETLKKIMKQRQRIYQD